jgi:hypothetical protein
MSESFLLQILWRILTSLRRQVEFRQRLDSGQSTYAAPAPFPAAGKRLKVTIIDDFGEQNKVAIRWTLKGTHEKEFAGYAATHEKFETHGADIFHFEGDKIKEVWTMFDALTPALELGIVEKVQPAGSEK